MTSPPNRAASYLFGDTDLAAERLRLLAEVFEPATREFLADARFGAPKRIADLGCGPGYTTQLMADVFRAATVRGLDSSASHLTRAQLAASSRVAFAVADVTQPLPGGPYDLVYCRYLLTHIARFQEAVESWGLALTPGGQIAIEENESIETSVPAVQQYLDIVAAMLADAGQKLYVGIELAEVTAWAGLDVVLREAVPIRVPAGRAAPMFVLNLRTWRGQPFIERNYKSATIAQLEYDLLTLAEAGERSSAKNDLVVFGRRRLILRKRPDEVTR